MSEANTNVSDERNRNTIIIVAVIVVFAIIFMYFWDRQQKRAFELQRLDSQMDVWEEWGPPLQNRQRQNRRLNPDMSGSGKGTEKIL